MDHRSLRIVYRDERHCSNCTHNTECYGNPLAERDPFSILTFFRLRANWDIRNKWTYTKGVVGQVCGNFTHIDPELRLRFNNNHSSGEWEI